MTASATPATSGAATPPVAPPKKPTGGRSGRPKGSVNGSGPVSGRRAAASRETVASTQAKTTAAVVLEGLTGLRSAPEAARALGVSVARYYSVEAQAVAGLLAACEPAPPGPPPGLATERELARLRHQQRQQDQELSRLRAVLRTTQRSLGVQPGVTPVAAATKPGAKSRRTRRPVVRAMTVVRRLLVANATATVAVTGAASTTPLPAGTASRVPEGG